MTRKRSLPYRHLRKIASAFALFALVCFVGASIFLIVGNGTHVYAQHYPVVDLAEALNARNQSVREKWDAGELGRAITRWDLYSRAASMGEATTSSVALKTLEHVHKALASNCSDELALQEVADVFAELPQGIHYRRLLERRDIVADIQTNRFEKSCVEVVKCAQKYTGPDNGVNLYSNSVREWCKDIVSNLRTLISLRFDRLQRLDDVNYGDDLLVNGEVSDGPFDLMDDVKKIADIMFAHADAPAKTNFYVMKEPAAYANPSPLAPKTYLSGLEQKAAEDPNSYMPPSQGDIPASPNNLRPELLAESMQDGDRSRLPRQGDPETSSPLSAPAAAPTMGPGQASITLPSAAGQAIANPLCFEPPPPEPEPNTLELAEKEQKITFQYNNELDLENRILGVVAQKLFWDGSEGVDERGWQTPPPDGDIEEQASQIANEIEINGGDDVVKDLYDQFKQCVKEETDIDPDTYLKAVWKGLSQPTALTACVRRQMCSELAVAQESLDNMWASFSIVICKVPPKKFGVNSNQAVYSIEDILDEHLNVCTNTKQSGQLLKHIQPKDAWTLMTSKTVFKDMLAFRVFMRGGMTRNDTDYPQEKTFHTEYNKYLMTNLLNISQKLTTNTERNKYVVIADPLAEQARNEMASTLEDSHIAETKVEAFKQAERSRLPVNPDVKNQRTSTARILEQFTQWTDQQIEYWKLVNDHTYMMRETVEAKVNTRQK